MRTPLLIIHSEDDLPCPISQAEGLFVALRLLGREHGVSPSPPAGAPYTQPQPADTACWAWREAPLVVASSLAQAFNDKCA